jgi:hypothetical protein
MAKKAKQIPYLEQWDTRYGLSDRVVIRKNGKFVDNVSLSALRKGTKVKSR